MEKLSIFAIGDHHDMSGFGEACALRKDRFGATGPRHYDVGPTDSRILDRPKDAVNRARGTPAPKVHTFVGH